MGLLAWRLYEVDGAEHAFLRAAAAAVLMAIAIFGFVIPALSYFFPSSTLARVLRDSGCAQPVAAAVGYQEPSLVFLAGTDTRLTDSIWRCRVPARRWVPVRLYRSAPGEELCAARRSDWPALHRRTSHRGHEFQHRTSHHHCGLSLARGLMSASDRLEACYRHGGHHSRYRLRTMLRLIFVLFARRPRAARRQSHASGCRDRGRARRDRGHSGRDAVTG